jgi:hypothetical protein
MLTDLKTYPGSMIIKQKTQTSHMDKHSESQGFIRHKFLQMAAYPDLTLQERKTLPKDRFWRVAGWTTRTRYEKRRLGS